MQPSIFQLGITHIEPNIVRLGIMKTRTLTLRTSIIVSLCSLTCCLLIQAQQVQSPIAAESGTTTTTSNTSEINTNFLREEKFNALNKKIRVLMQSPKPSWSEYEQTARELMKEFPDRPDGYDALLNVMQFGGAKRARSLANEMTNSFVPEEYRLWANGLLYRLDLYGKPVDLKFKALDGRDVDLAKMRGKVVLIDFWATGCVPCVAALPEIKAVYDKYHAKGFEVVGIAFDTDRDRLARFIKERELPWPESFEGQGGIDNSFGQKFGVRAIPHTLIIDKKGCLAIDDFYVRPGFESVVTNLLVEP
jgi:thiol-disulfide isomerase/thioredoxin